MRSTEKTWTATWNQISYLLFEFIEKTIIFYLGWYYIPFFIPSFSIIPSNITMICLDE